MYTHEFADIISCGMVRFYNDCMLNAISELGEGGGRVMKRFIAVLMLIAASLHLFLPPVFATEEPVFITVLQDKQYSYSVVPSAMTCFSLVKTCPYSQVMNIGTTGKRLYSLGA
jgi:hypothetical protein